MGGYLTQLLAVADAELRKLGHDPWELASRAIQPVLWLLLFGNVMARVRGLAPQSIPYLDFLAPGILAQSALFVAIFYGISAIWERNLGVLHRYLVSPAPRSALVSGKTLSSGARALSQAVIVYFCAAAMGVHLSLRPANVAAAILLITLGSALFSTFSLIIACIVRTRERFMGIGQVLTMPIFFASNAIYPGRAHANLAADPGAAQSADLRGRRVARRDARTRLKRLRTDPRFLRARGRGDRDDRRRHPDVSTHDRMTRGQGATSSSSARSRESTPLEPRVLTKSAQR